MVMSIFLSCLICIFINGFIRVSVGFHICSFVIVFIVIFNRLVFYLGRTSFKLSKKTRHKFLENVMRHILW